MRYWSDLVFGKNMVVLGQVFVDVLCDVNCHYWNVKMSVRHTVYYTTFVLAEKQNVCSQVSKAKGKKEHTISTSKCWKVPLTGVHSRGLTPPYQTTCGDLWPDPTPEALGPKVPVPIRLSVKEYLRKNTKVNIWTALFRLVMYSPSISIKYETARPYNHGSLQSNWKFERACISL